MKLNLLIAMITVSNICAMENINKRDKNLDKEQLGVLNVSADNNNLKIENQNLIPTTENKKSFLTINKKKDATGRKKYSRIK